ncbi:MAG: hypothetical protein U1U88_000730, partial [Lawsonella clevelandensis]
RNLLVRCPGGLGGLLHGCYAYSLACQYRVREGMTEQKAHKLCQAILNGIRVLNRFFEPIGTLLPLAASYQTTI